MNSRVRMSSNPASPPPPAGPTGPIRARTCHQIAAIRGEFVRRWLATSQTIGGQMMKRLTSAQLFAPPKIARKTKARLERAKFVVVAARERAAETAQRYAA